MPSAYKQEYIHEKATKLEEYCLDIALDPFIISFLRGPNRANVIWFWQ